MTPTDTYTRLHDAFAAVARREKIAPSDARVLLAIYDLGGRARSDRLEQALGGSNGGSMVRRSLCVLYDRGLAVGVASDHGGRRKRGVRTLVTITLAGMQIIEAVQAALLGEAERRCAPLIDAEAVA